MKITAARVLHDYVLRVTYNNGKERDFDFASFLSHPQYKRHAKPDAFARFKVSADGFDISWGRHNLIIDSDYLYKHGKPVSGNVRAKAA